MLKLALIESPKICPVSWKLQTSTKPKLSLWRIVFCRFASQKHQGGNLWACLLYFPCISALRSAAGSPRLWCSPRAPCQQELPCLVLLCVQSSLLLCLVAGHTPVLLLLEVAAGCSVCWNLGQSSLWRTTCTSTCIFQQAKTKNYNEVNHKCTCSLRSVDAFRTEKSLHNW